MWNGAGWIATGTYELRTQGMTYGLHTFGAAVLPWSE
jgi:hypothetical protein